jgi:hypothetical protein
VEHWLQEQPPADMGLEPGVLFRDEEANLEIAPRARRLVDGAEVDGGLDGAGLGAEQR